jgi:hypothetical protein
VPDWIQWRQSVLPRSLGYPQCCRFFLWPG